MDGSAEFWTQILKIPVATSIAVICASRAATKYVTVDLKKSLRHASKSAQRFFYPSHSMIYLLVLATSTSRKYY